ncbi:hypothetical protein BC834DRAFT_979448 [Gloeopeniophorella convolvens]|nr:hypothetical protein BC834DRAFT_979448 [Gloeopeniophorella convolvens]
MRSGTMAAIARCTLALSCGKSRKTSQNRRLKVAVSAPVSPKPAGDAARRAVNVRDRKIGNTKEVSDNGTRVEFVTAQKTITKSRTVRVGKVDTPSQWGRWQFRHRIGSESGGQGVGVIEGMHRAHRASAEPYHLNREQDEKKSKWELDAAWCVQREYDRQPKTAAGTFSLQ